MSSAITRSLASEVLKLAHEPLPEDVHDAARRSLLNVLGTAVGASRHPAVDILVGFGQAHGGTGVSPVPGRTELLDPLTSATATGLAAHLDDFDDTHLATVIHPGAATVAALLALAAVRPADGSTLLRAFALGCEVQLRIGVAMSPEHYDDGWHITGTCAPLGAAVASAILMRLDEDHLASAMGLAGSQTLGIREGFGSMMKAFHPGKGAANGVLAALLAGRGFTGPDDVLEDERGFFNVLSPAGYRSNDVLDGLGDRWELTENTFKPYPCGIVIHPAIDAAVALAPRVPELEEVESIRARVHPLVPELTGNLDPKDGLQARFSAAHGIAAGLADGRVGLPQYADERVLADDVRRLRAMVSFQVDGDMPRDAATITVRLRTGEERGEHVEHARGSLARPLTDEELHDKVHDLVEPLLPGRTDAIVAAVEGLEDAPDACRLREAVRP